MFINFHLKYFQVKICTKNIDTKFEATRGMTGIICINIELNPMQNWVTSYCPQIYSIQKHMCQEFPSDEGTLIS